MRGHIRQRGKDTWQVIIPIGKDAHGKYKYASETVHGTKKDAEARLAVLLAQSNRITQPTKMTVGEYLDFWLEEYTVNLRHDTREWYKLVIREHIKPTLGSIPLAKLNPLIVQKWLNDEMREGKLTPSTINGHFRVLRSALNKAVALKILPEAPLTGVEPPKRRKHGGTSLTREQVIAFLRAAKEHTDRYPLYLMAVSTGMRRGEILGLRWQDADMAQRLIFVRQQLRKGGHNPRFGDVKTENGVRVIPMPQILADALTIHKIEQDMQKKAYGTSWRDYDLVFTTLGGGPISPRNLHRQFKLLLKKAGLPEDIRFHDLRHTCATLLKANKVNSKAISEQLGHYSEDFTEEVYTHLLDEMMREPANAMDKLLGPLAGS